MVSELRMLIAEWLLGLAVKVAPKNKEGATLVSCIALYLRNSTNNF